MEFKTGKSFLAEACCSRPAMLLTPSHSPVNPKIGHRDNIFDAKFMPSTNDEIVISVAGDSEVRIFNLDALSSSNRLQHIYTCHSDPVKRICTEAYNPYEFLTCSEDGK
jgi:WD40 repeat protein